MVTLLEEVSAAATEGAALGAAHKRGICRDT